MSDKLNKHGLGRYISSEVAMKIRKDSGYGCVVCGAIFCQYEHIDPEFHDAFEHDPDKMALLCARHHDDVTHGRMHKDDVWEAKLNPHNLNVGINFSGFYNQRTQARIYIGSNLLGSAAVGKINLGEVVLSLYGKPILWFENSDSKISPINTCAIFYGDGMEPSAYINRNCFIKEKVNYDFNSVSTRVEIRSAPGIIDLILDFPGRRDIAIKKLRMNFLDCEVRIDSKGSVTFKYGNSVLQSTGSNFKSISLGRALQGDMFDGIRYSKISKFVEICLTNKEILSYNGEVMGWLDMDNVIYNKSYNFVGRVSSLDNGLGIVSTYIHEDFANIYKLDSISNTERFMIGYQYNSYPSNEPIWISQGDKASKMIRKETIHDLGYRVFNIDGCYK